MPFSPTALTTKASEFLFGQVGMTHRFVVQIDNSSYDLGSWSKVTGLSVTWQKHSFREGVDGTEYLVIGNPTFTDIKLSRAACSDSATVQQWLKHTYQSQEQLSGAIYMIDFIGMPVITWTLLEFFPIGWTISEFDSTSPKPAIETLTLAHTGFLDTEIRGGL